MKIAVVYDQGVMGAHFGHAKQMKIYRTAPTGIILESNIVDTNVSGHLAMCDFLRDHQVQAVICQNIGKEACSLLLLECNIDLYAGLSGDPDLAVKLLLEGKLDEFQIKYYDQIYGKNAKNTCKEDCDCAGDCSSCGHEGEGCSAIEIG